jgi:hypothetical protein
VTNLAATNLVAAALSIRFKIETGARARPHERRTDCRCAGVWGTTCMHGEFKTAGGKLVVVDFDVASGRLSDVSVSGDFFLEPPDALDAINGALDGAPAELDIEGLASRIRAALPDNVEMVGFSPEAIATAVKRGLR